MSLHSLFAIRGIQRFHHLFTLLAVVGLLGLPHWGRAAAPTKPNVLLILTDDQGTLDAGCFGSTDLHTPNLDKLAASGVRFTQAYAHTVCCPSRAALLTGRHPQRSGVNNWTQGSPRDPLGINMDLSEVTLAEALKAAGYQTALFGKWHLGGHLDFGPEKQGFNEFFGIRGGFIDNYKHYHLHQAGRHDLFDGPQEVEASGKYFPEMVVEHALSFIERNRERPFFLYLALNTPHYPNQPLPEHEQLYKEMPMPRRSYAAWVTTTDFYIGRVLARLDVLGLRENTIIVFQSDNGHSVEDYHITVDNHSSGYPKGHNYGANGGGGNSGKWIGNKTTFLEGGIRTPAIISWPRTLPQGAVRDQVVSIMDWYPTVLELCGLPLPHGVKLDGKSLTAVAKDAKAASPHPLLHFQWQNDWAVREGDWKLIYSAARKARPEKVQLFNLADAEPERKDYAVEQPVLVARLRQLHEQFQQDVTPEQTAAGKDSTSPAYVRASSRDPRYFELDDGRPYVPIGFNLVRAPMEDEFVSVLDTMASNHVNYCRVWLNDLPWKIEHQAAGVFDEARGKILRRFLDLAAQRGVGVKLCLEEFREITTTKKADKDNALLHRANGGPFSSMQEYLYTPPGQALLLRKVAFYQKHVGDHPAVFAWELWNEMNCVRADWIPWTEQMIPELHRIFPKNMVVQSLGSFDAGQRGTYQRLSLMPGNDVAQVHRYLDLGAKLEVCHGPMDVLAADAVAELLAFKPGKPVLLAETGAVSPRHTGVSALYAKDKAGMLLHDVIFAPFFAGAAGTGEIWFWRDSIQKPDLWRQFARFARAIEGVDPSAEHFQPVTVEHPRLRVYLLNGQSTLLAWCRDQRNDWPAELERGESPEQLTGLKLDLKSPLAGRKVATVRGYSPWTDTWSDLEIKNGAVTLPPFQRSMVVKVQLAP